MITGCASEPTETPLERIDLRTAIGDRAVAPVGIAIGAGGERFVFDETRGLYRIDGDTAVAIVPGSALPVPNTPIQLPFTDLAMIAPGVFALTAIGDGFLLDTSAMTLTQHFCYVPDGLPSALVQRTDAMAFDAALDRIYAQPVTYDQQGAFQYSQLAGYERATGTDVAWYDADASVAATGMTMIPEVGLILGQGSRLSRFDLAASRSIQLDDLERFGVRSIDGLAVDTTGGTLVIVDNTTDELVAIELSRVALE